ncbi:Alpha/Beta hydrolase protein [Roridomyces roridus]|uniref:Alpha/Beta hydrolase protein n=1 Tax=Roridomyces roridus TaxID=1738132 RepID=A0AAD7FFK9_9AGAR|nr:Alpha/Beta hydrolase protein [Roridomyces roridus]
MPSLDLPTANGLGRFHYTLSTPEDADATAIVAGLPTLVLLHPVYIGSHIFHPIFADPRLRRFNLVTMDLRGHGQTSADVEDTYGRETGAKDVLNLMAALKLPACHLMGVSMGACMALQVAALDPEKVLSMFMLSPLPLQEPPESAEGRQEIYDCWVAGFADYPDRVDDSALEDAVYGAVQLAFNNQNTNLGSALISHALPSGIRNWSPDKFSAFHTASVKFFLNRFPLPKSQLERIRAPIALVHCSDDVAYPISYSEELLTSLRSAQLDARIYTIEGAPHFGNVTHVKETNTMLYDFVLSNLTPGIAIPAAQSGVKSPFAADLMAFGLEEGDGESDSDEGDY